MSGFMHRERAGHGPEEGATSMHLHFKMTGAVNPALMKRFGNLKQSWGGGSLLKSQVESFKRLLPSAAASPLSLSPQSKPIQLLYFKYSKNFTLCRSANSS